jgi:predicted nucleic-acid-binding Zn-ribbon protein
MGQRTVRGINEEVTQQKEKEKMTTIQFDKYIEPRCFRCGHTANYHNYDECHHLTNTDPHGTNMKVKCKCPGFTNDLSWPRLVTEGGNADFMRELSDR